MTQITLRGITKRFPGRPSPPAVADIDLVVESGEFFTLLGPSGCGKTTTLRMIAGFSWPTAGSIAFDRDDVTRRPAHKRGTGMVFQNYALFPHMTVGGNVDYGLRVRKIPRAQRDLLVAEALRQVSLEGYADRRIDALSGGQQQRVALARALVIRPRVLLLDEPLSNLDAKLREATRREIRSIQTTAGITALYVTHDQAEAMALSDRIAVMSDGRVHQVGAPPDVYRHPATAFVARFIGNSNVFDACVVAGMGRHRTVELTGKSGETLELPVTLPVGVEPVDGHVLVTARPEHVVLVAPGSPRSLTATVKAVEFTGLATNVELDLAGRSVVATVIDATTPVRVGEDVGLSLCPDRLWAVRP
jgi:iron(III) transport system ATP-binding protein